MKLFHNPMQRRFFLQTFASLVGVLPFGGVRAWAQRVGFPGNGETALKELAATVLPASLGKPGTDRVAEKFIRWVAAYRPGAEMQSGYGITRIRQTPPSPASRYTAQLAELSRTVLAQADMGARRKALAGTLQAAKIRDLPNLPDGNHVVTDLMSFYFGSSEANDLAYGATIGRDECRTLKNSSQAPPPLKG